MCNFIFGENLSHHTSCLRVLLSGVPKDELEAAIELSLQESHTAQEEERELTRYKAIMLIYICPLLWWIASMNGSLWILFTYVWWQRTLSTPTRVNLQVHKYLSVKPFRPHYNGEFRHLAEVDKCENSRLHCSVVRVDEGFQIRWQLQQACARGETLI